MIPKVSNVSPSLLQDQTSGLGNLPGMGNSEKQGFVRSLTNAQKLYESAETPQELKLKKVADEFVSMLHSMMIKQMDSGIERTDLLGGGAMEETFRPMLLDEYSKMASSQQANPLTHRLYETMYDATVKRVESAKGGEGAEEAPSGENIVKSQPFDIQG